MCEQILVDKKDFIKLLDDQRLLQEVLRVHKLEPWHNYWVAYANFEVNSDRGTTKTSVIQQYYGEE